MFFRTSRDSIENLGAFVRERSLFFIIKEEKTFLFQLWFSTVALHFFASTGYSQNIRKPGTNVIRETGIRNITSENIDLKCSFTHTKTS